MHFNILVVGREILTLGEGFNTQVITLWCFNIVGREILTLGYIFIFVDPIASALIIYCSASAVCAGRRKTKPSQNHLTFAAYLATGDPSRPTA